MTWWNYPEPKTPQLTDDQRNQLRELQHEPCEGHCVECGACILDLLVEGVDFDGDLICHDCVPVDDYHD